jgi:predicted O-linked N-acetylglucosamine transferase (SPINDLY family)
MGVPIITRFGDSPVSRAGLSQLVNLGIENLESFASPTEEGYIANAIALAKDLSKLADLRKNIRSMMERSPLMNARRCAGNLENAYRNIWRTWCQSQRRESRADESPADESPNNPNPSTEAHA